MCGIAGLMRNSAVLETGARDAVQCMTDYMRNRGPDAEGMWSDKSVVLGHRRLAIIDLDERANQPMVSSDGRYVIVFNGEIYNFRELKSELENQGFHFNTASDTEVILTLFSKYGEGMLKKLRGMFAFSIWDGKEESLFMARDPYGIKPLYYTLNEHGFLFASQVKALLASGCVSRDLEAAGLAGFYLWGNVPDPWTLYKNVFALPAGHYLVIKPGTVKSPVPVCWYDIRKHWQSGATTAIPDAELQSKIREAVKEAVEAHRIADVPICVFLSGGIDSGAIAALVSELGIPVEGITVGFDEFTDTALDEVPFARQIAEKYHMPHHVYRVTPARFVDEIPRIMEAMDQPSIDGINTWFAAKAAAERGFKVVLSGLGGDELFCGYTSFKMLPRIHRQLKLILAIPGAKMVIRGIGNMIAKYGDKVKYTALAEYMDSIEGLHFLRRSLYVPRELSFLMGEDMASEGLRKLSGSPPGIFSVNAKDDINAVALLESTEYMRNQLLRDSDWASMGNSLELRTPLVDVRLLSTLAPWVSSFAEGRGKNMLAHTPAVALPEQVVNRPKTGFAIPMEKWLAENSTANIWVDMPQSQKQKNRWGRRWAKILIEHETGFKNNKYKDYC